LIQDGIVETTDEENPNNPYWNQVEQMKKEAAMEIARDKEIKERIRAEKIVRDQKYYRPTPEKKSKRITKRKPKIKPKKIVSSEKLRLIELKKAAMKRIAKEKKKSSKKKVVKIKKKGKK
jgi:hypothetical protein